MHNIPAQIEGFHMLVGEYPTHILMSSSHYEYYLKEGNYTETVKHLFGLEVIITDVPIDEPRILKIEE